MKTSKKKEIKTSKVGPCGSFLQETHSDSKVEKEWKEDFHDQVFFLTEKQILVVSKLLPLKLKKLLLKANKQTRKASF